MAEKEIDVKSIVRVIELRGMQYANGERMLSLIPTKFKKKVWISKGTFAVTEAQEQGASTLVRTSISRFIDLDEIKDLKKLGLWPAAFTKIEVPVQITKPAPKKEKETKSGEKREGEEEEEEEEEEGDDLFLNPNHQIYPESDEEAEDDNGEDD